ncbi:MAG: DivIVA domain-containing protein [Clostridium sp.]|uniref:DivIVA domain-containing protein n=1 Tax=Clostridium TaxID=1485 RepID=UPI000DD07497|nr:MULTISPECIES: DivIVA domain-containing protein [Clostridium]MDU5802076.1 DivIVA domain-containing protein [Fusobacterium periodonticum]MDB2086269.1 DivIVA domain-containing protein [Clostridium paraputrificum]MDB2119545.1 DivIVA domain-containing protein [Clostridium paraputrificum]MDU1031551.1 DivIVA domain-containing protein [Clostridium sp.]MDU2754126.1 DivIVA domain-containing protein [Clostridium sp.]
MKLTPMDINNKEFKRGLRGYNPEEVDEFLDEVVENYEELYKDNSKLREKVASLTEQIEHYSKIESTIQNTLVLAQNAADQAKSSAEKEAELVVKNANETAQRIVDKAHADVIQINDEYDRVKQEFIKFRAKFRNFINTQLETFDDLEKDVTKNYSISTPVEDEAAIDSEVQFDEESFKLIEEDVLTDNIDEIKSFFASKED